MNFIILVNHSNSIAVDHLRHRGDEESDPLLFCRFQELMDMTAEDVSRAIWLWWVDINDTIKDTHNVSRETYIKIVWILLNNSDFNKAKDTYSDIISKWDFTLIKRELVLRCLNVRDAIKSSDEHVITLELDKLNDFVVLSESILRLTLKKADVNEIRKSFDTEEEEYLLNVNKFARIFAKILFSLSKRLDNLTKYWNLINLVNELGVAYWSNLHIQPYSQSGKKEDIEKEYHNNVDFVNNKNLSWINLFKSKMYRVKIYLKFCKEMGNNWYSLNDSDLSSKSEHIDFLMETYNSFNDWKKLDSLNVVLSDLIEKINWGQENISHLLKIVFYLISFEESVDVGVVEKLIHEVNEKQLRDHNYSEFLELYRIRELQKSIKDQKAIENATIDQLTWVKNRWAFDEALQKFIDKIWREENNQKSHWLIMFDIDKFKEINDKNWHTTWDEVLKLFAQCIQSNIRKTDEFFRYWGEEFALLMSCKNSDKLYSVIDNIRKKLESQDYSGVKLGESVTASIWITTINTDKINEDADFIDEADQALYLAKKTWRNKTLIYNENTHRELEEVKNSSE